MPQDEPIRYDVVRIEPQRTTNGMRHSPITHISSHGTWEEAEAARADHQAIRQIYSEGIWALQDVSGPPNTRTSA